MYAVMQPIYMERGETKKFIRVYTSWAKKWHHFCTFHNFTKYQPISKILSLSKSGENLQ